MNCKQAQQDIALIVGRDLDDPRERDSVKRHVSTCPSCREHYRQMKGALKLLGQADAPETYRSTGSLWPELATRINEQNTDRWQGQFNGWMPFIAMTAACFILMLVVNEQPTPMAGGPHHLRGPGFATSPVMLPMIESPLLKDMTLQELTPTPTVPFEKRSAADDARRIEKLRREANVAPY